MMIKTVRTGFSLFECLLYIGMFVFVMTQLFQYVVSVQKQVKVFARNASASLGWLIAQDILARDLVTAPAHKDAWITIAASELLWVCSDGNAYHWYLKDSKIMRVTGTYTIQTKSWQHSTKSTVAENITQFTVAAVQGLQGIQRIAITCTGKNEAGNLQTMQITVALRNRKLL